LYPTEEKKENEANLSGITVLINGITPEKDGVYVTMEDIPHKIDLSKENINYQISIGRKERILPFDVHLDEFTQTLYPGTSMARGFSSRVTINDNGNEWPALISMNEPLRYKGYTLYQASFSLRPDGEYSILSVVKNQGRIFPYISGILMVFGLILHLVFRLNHHDQILIAFFNLSFCNFSCGKCQRF
jgi:hypothetical protein